MMITGGDSYEATVAERESARERPEAAVAAAGVVGGWQRSRSTATARSGTSTTLRYGVKRDLSSPHLYRCATTRQHGTTPENSGSG